MLNRHIHNRQARYDHAEQAVQATQLGLDAIKNSPLPKFVPPQQSPSATSSPKPAAIATDHIKLAWTAEDVGPYGGSTKKRVSESVDDAFWNVVDEQGQSLECLSCMFASLFVDVNGSCTMLRSSHSSLSVDNGCRCRPSWLCRLHQRTLRP